MSIIGKLRQYGVDISKQGTMKLRGALYANNFPGSGGGGGDGGSGGVPSGYAGNIVYVDSDITSSGNGRTWESAMKTITEALAAAGDHDTIMVQKGIYDEGAVLNITQEGLRLIGMGTTGDIWGTSSIKASAANHICLTINANEVEIGNMSFIQNNANVIISVATTATTYKTHIHDCYFGGSSTQTVGVSGSYSGTYDSADVLVEDCTFYQCVTGVDLNGTRCTIRNNVFLLSASDTAIEVSQSGGNRPELRIIGNIIRGANSSDKGIYFAATPTEALFTCIGNHVMNVATPITAAKYTSWYDDNYWGLLDGQYHSNPDGSNHTGRVFYVDANAGTTGLDGRCWRSAFLTINEAITVATTAYDTIYVARGDYDEDAVIAITTTGLRIVGTGDGVMEGQGEQHLKTTIYSASASHLMTINAHEVIIDNLGFYNPDDTYDCIRVSTTGAYYKVTIRNCRFVAGTGEYGIYSSGTFDSPDLLIENCTFKDFNTSAVAIYATRAMVKGCIVHTLAAKNGLELLNVGANRAGTTFVDNKVFGCNSTDVGIAITGATTPTEAYFHMMGNSVEHCATPVTTAKYTSWYDGNYWGLLDDQYHSQSDDDSNHTGRVFHVDTNAGTTGLDGRCWRSAFLTINEAVAVATTAYDTIYVARGDYDEDAVINITTIGLRIIGVGDIVDGSGEQHLKTTIYSASASHLMTINNHEVILDNLGFYNPDDNYDCIRVSTTMAAYKVTIRNCRFVAGTGEYGIYSSGTFDSPDLLIENCTFKDFNTSAIAIYCTRAMVRGCIVHTLAAKNGIELLNIGANRAGTTFVDNKVFGCNSTDVGIAITGATAPTEAYFHMNGNVVENCAYPATAAKYASWYEGNDFGASGALCTLGRVYSIKNEDVLINGATKDVFTVADGAIEIIGYSGQCTTILGSPGTTKVGVDATAGLAYDADFSTGVNCDSVTEGDVITFHTTTSGESVLNPTTGVNAGDPLSWFCPAGVILNTHTSSTGAITWYMTFRALDSGVSVVTA